MDTRVQIQFKGTEDYKLMLKQAALDRRTTVQSMIESAVLRYLGEKPDSKPAEHPISSKNPVEHEQLDTILASGRQLYVDAIRQNLKAFAQAVEDAKARAIQTHIPITRSKDLAGAKESTRSNEPGVPGTSGKIRHGSAPARGAEPERSSHRGD